MKFYSVSGTVTSFPNVFEIQYLSYAHSPCANSTTPPPPPPPPMSADSCAPLPTPSSALSPSRSCRSFQFIQLHFPCLGASNEFSQILSNTVSILSMVPDLCTSQAICDILPIVLRLVTCVFNEAASYEVPLVEASQTVVAPKMPHVVSSTLKALKELVGSQRLMQSEYSKEFVRYFQR